MGDVLKDSPKKAPQRKAKKKEAPEVRKKNLEANPRKKHYKTFTKSERKKQEKHRKTCIGKGEKR